jgi:elongation factor Ts
MNIKDIKKLRQQTGAGVVAAKKALEEAKGDMKKAQEIIRQKGLAKADKKSDRETKSGQVYAYVHGDGVVGALVEINCETDFVARNEEFGILCKEIAMQIVSMNPKDVKDLLAQKYIRDVQKTIQDLVKQAIAKLGENITISRFERFELGE